MSQKKHHVTIKGTKDGLSFLLDDNCAIDTLYEELEEKLSLKHYQSEHGLPVQVNVIVGNRYLTAEQEEKLREIIVSGKNLVIEQIQSNVISKEEAEAICEEKQMVSVARIIRSGQVMNVTGDLLLIGDVNPGGKVVATGNIYILGALKGIAHAGSSGEEDAIIAASLMEPTQLKIADLFRQEFPIHEQEDKPIMECAYISEMSNIELDGLQRLQKLRPHLGKLPNNLSL